MYRPFVDRGLPLSFMIDNLHIAAATDRQLKAQLLCLLPGMVALGFVFGTPKCEFGLVLRLVFLGMGLDAAAERFFIPADKLTRLQQELTGPSSAAARDGQAGGQGAWADCLSAPGAAPQQPVHAPDEPVPQGDGQLGHPVCVTAAAAQ